MRCLLETLTSLTVDPTESIKNLAFSLSVLDAAPALKADALTKHRIKKKRGGE